MSSTILLNSNNFDSSLGLIGDTPSLTKKEEFDLAIDFMNNNNIESAKQLVLANLRFVAHIARGYSGYGLPLNDIVQEGNIGLMKAVKRFDPNKGVRLVTFAVYWIRSEIKEYVLRNFRTVKLATTKSQRKLFFNLRKSKKTLENLTKNEAAALSESLNVDIKSVYEMEIRLSGSDVGFDLTGDDFFASENYLKNTDDPSSIVERNDLAEYKKKLLSKALSSLDERKQFIMKSRWLSEEKITLIELSNIYGVSAERIRQLESEALTSIKKAMDF